MTYDILSGNQKGNFVIDPNKGNNILALCCCGRDVGSDVMQLEFDLRLVAIVKTE